MEQTAVSPQDVVSLGAHLLEPAEHDPHPPVYQPQRAPWEEMGANVFELCSGEGHSNLLVMHVPLWFHQVGIEVAGHKHLCPVVPLSDILNDGLYGQIVV